MVLTQEQIVEKIVVKAAALGIDLEVMAVGYLMNGIDLMTHCDFTTEDLADKMVEKFLKGGGISERQNAEASSQESAGTGAELIAAERQRQITEEGITGEDDIAANRHEELALAAVCYAAPELVYVKKEADDGAYIEFVDPWPWHESWDKRPKHDRLHQLVIAGALIAAEIDRLLALKAKGAA